MNLIRWLAFDDKLSVAPVQDFALSGATGGPFTLSQTNFTVSNDGTSKINWSAYSSSAWLSVNPSEGSLAPNTSTSVIVRVTSLATNLPDGLYSGSVVFLNTNIDSRRQRTFTLQVGLMPVTFDDLQVGHGEPVPSGYAGFDWFNFGTLDSESSTNLPSGYQPGTISPPTVAYNEGGKPASIIGFSAFDLLSAYVSAAWRNNLILYATGSVNGVIIQTLATNLSNTEPTLLNFNFYGVDRVDFGTAGGFADAAYPGSGYQFVMDNVLLVPNVLQTTSPRLEFSHSDTGELGLAWSTPLGPSYEIEFTTALFPGNWQPLGPPQAATNAVMKAADTSPSPQRFYRLHVLP